MITRLKNRYRVLANQISSVKYVLVAGLLALSAITNILLVLETKELRATISALKTEQSTVLGTRLPPLTAQDISGQNVTIRLEDSEHPTLLYVFTPACRWCKKNEDNIRSLANQTGERFRIIGVSLSEDGLAEYIQERFPPVTVVKPDALTMTGYKFSGTPTTILVSSRGVVLKVWKGAYNDSIQRELEEYFNIKLPGLREVS